MGGPIVVEGRSAWRQPHADRVAFLVDAAQYYRAFVEAVERAERVVRVLAWDVHSRTPLTAGENGSPLLELGDFIVAMLERKPELHFYVLSWDFIGLYAADREPRFAGHLAPGTHPRLHFQFDGCHPRLGCHHQKVVVVDDAVAFAGGLDLTAGRWNTPEHRPHEPLRWTAKGEIGPPFHDVMMAVAGDAAAALGELCRERWYRATGERLPAVTASRDPWPRRLAAVLEDVPVAIARTEPAIDGRPGVREIARLNEDAIRAARRSIYLETQYLAAREIGALLAERLAEPDGPEIVIVVPKESTDWLEALTMGVMRTRLVRRLRRADRYDHLRVFYPTVPGIGDSYVKVHSKVMIVDDDFLRIGSSNLCSRSLTVDTECDVAIEADDDAAVARAIAGFRARLLGEHLGRPPQAVARAIERRRSLIGAIKECRRGERTLVDVGSAESGWVEGVARVTSLLDDDARGAARASTLAAVAVVALMIAAVIGWRVTPLAAWADPERLARAAAAFRNHPAAPLAVTAGYLVGTLLMLPVNVMILATALAFRPALGLAYSLVGCIVSGVATYGIGWALGRRAVERYGGDHALRWRTRIAKHGVLAVAALRLLPIAPFGVVNVLAGASAIGLGRYTVGTALGMAPGVVALTIFGRQLGNVLEHPSASAIAALGALSAAIGVGAWWLGRLARRWEGAHPVR